jgi:hypothetical protein
MHASLEDLRRALRLRPCQPAFDDASCRHTAFTACSGLQDLLRIVADRAPGSYPLREALSRAMLAEYQRTLAEPWPSALLIAYAPLLLSTSRAVESDLVPPADLNQIVVEAFLTVARSFPLDRWRTHTARRLKHRTRERVFATLNRAEREVLRVRADDETARTGGSRTPPDSALAEPAVSDETNANIKLLIELAGDLATTLQLQVVAETCIRNRPLKEFVASEHPEAGAAEQKRLYEQLKRARTRTLDRIHDALSDPSCPRRRGGPPLS